MNKTVTVVITTYYRNERLRNAIKSVDSQTYEPIEIIVVDDSGEANAEEVVDEFEEVTYLPNQENLGPQQSRCKGVEQATGDYVQFLDDDDRLYKSKIQRCVELIEGNPDLGVVYCGIDNNETGEQELPDPEFRGDVLKQTLYFKGKPCLPSTMLIERELLEQISPLSDRYTGSEDIQMMIELSKLTKFDFVNEALVFYGYSGDSVSTSLKQANARQRIYEDYADHYEMFPDDIRNRAKEQVHLLRGAIILKQKWWSSKAITEFSRALYYSPDRDVKNSLRVGASLFGRPGIKLARFVNDRIQA